MSSTLFQRIRAWIHAVTAPPAESQPQVDVSWLASEAQYAHLTITEDDRADLDECTVRCDLCGRLFPIREMPDVLDHVAGHDGQGAAEINPFAQPSMGRVRETILAKVDAEDEP